MAPSSPLSSLLKRQIGADYGNGGSNCDGYEGWWCGDNSATRYGITAAVVVAILLAILFARSHARRRLAQGKQPYWYHRFLVRRRMQNPQAYQNQPVRNSMFRMNGNSGTPNAQGANGWQRTPGPWGGEHAMGTERHATDYEMPGWQYPPPPPAYVPATEGGSAQPPNYYAPPPMYAKDSKAGAMVMTAEAREAEQQREMERHAGVQPEQTGQSTAAVYR